MCVCVCVCACVHACVCVHTFFKSLYICMTWQVYLYFPVSVTKLEGGVVH